jgi:hypothetical protein
MHAALIAALESAFLLQGVQRPDWPILASNSAFVRSSIEHPQGW